MASKSNGMKKRDMVDAVLTAAVKRFVQFKANGGTQTEMVIALNATGILDTGKAIDSVCNTYGYTPSTTARNEFIHLYETTLRILATEMK